MSSYSRKDSKSLTGNSCGDSTNSEKTILRKYDNSWTSYHLEKHKTQSPSHFQNRDKQAEWDAIPPIIISQCVQMQLFSLLYPQLEAANPGSLLLFVCFQFSVSRWQAAVSCQSWQVEIGLNQYDMAALLTSQTLRFFVLCLNYVPRRT